MIRKATTDDTPAMVALQKAIELENAILGYGADSPQDWAKRDLAWTFLAMRGTEAVGFIYCCPRPYTGECVFPANAKVLEIVDLVLAADFRNQGYGHELVTAAQNQARANGFTHLRVYSSAKRFDDIVRFYRSVGFGPWYVEMTKEIRAEPTSAGDVATRAAPEK